MEIDMDAFGAIGDSRMRIVGMKPRISISFEEEFEIEIDNKIITCSLHRKHNDEWVIFFEIDERIEESKRNLETRKVRNEREKVKMDEDYKLEKERADRLIKRAKEQKAEINKALTAIKQISKEKKE